MNVSLVPRGASQARRPAYNGRQVCALVEYAAVAFTGKRHGHASDSISLLRMSRRPSKSPKFHAPVGASVPCSDAPFICAKLLLSNFFLSGKATELASVSIGLRPHL